MKKGAVWGIVGGVVGLVVVWVVVVAAGVGSEASNMDRVLKDQLHSHVTQDALASALSKEGYAVTPGASFAATGPKHSLLVYTTWLTVTADFTPEGQMKGYQLARAG